MPTTEYGVDEFFQNAGTSPKMVYDVAGVLGWSPHNLLPRSSEFDNAAAWTITVSTIGANAILAPDATMTADAFIPNNTTTTFAVNNINSSTAAASTYTFSVYTKNGTLGNNWLEIAVVSSSVWRAWFNLATGAKGTSVGSPTSYNIVSVGSGWYRIDVTFVAGATNTICYLQARDADGSLSAITGNGTSPCCYLWGAQLNLGSVPTAYLPTTTAARFGLALDYDPVTHAARGLLCEPQATNVVVQSSSFDNAIWSVFGGVAKVGAAPIPAPDGTMTAYEISFGSSGGPSASALYQGSPAGTVASFFVRAKTGTTTVRLFNDTNASSDLTVTDTAWTRLVFVGSGSQPSLRNNVAGNSGNVYVWGAQLETGTVATSYIPTLAATVTRAGDVITFTPASINYSATAGSWWADVDLKTFISNGWIIGESANRVYFAMQSDVIFNMNDAVVNVTKTVASTVGAHKLVMAFANADRALTADGLTPATDTTAGIAFGSPGTPIGLGGYPLASSLNINGYIRQVRYLPRRPSNAELVSMTGS